jgi:heptosyltransferase III
MKILVIKRDKLGDLLLTTPMLGHLRAALPHAEIHLLANDYNAWVAEANTDIDRRWIYRRVRHGGRVSLSAAVQSITQDFALRRAGFDWVIVANGDESPRGISRGLAARGERCIAYCNDGKTYPRLSNPLPLRRDLHEVDRLVAMLVPLGIAPAAKPQFPHYSLPPDSAEFARGWLAENGLVQGGYVVLGLGARRPKKQPAAEQVLRWCGHVKRIWGLDTVFMWTPGRSDNPLYPGDDDVAQPVLEARVEYIRPYRGPIREALGLIWGARTSLFPDSGLMHFAAASPGGVIGFFAETDASPGPVQWGPRGPKATFLEAEKSVAELPDEALYQKLEGLLA